MTLDQSALSLPDEGYPDLTERYDDLTGTHTYYHYRVQSPAHTGRSAAEKDMLVRAGSRQSLLASNLRIKTQLLLEKEKSVSRLKRYINELDCMLAEQQARALAQEERLRELEARSGNVNAQIRVAHEQYQDRAVLLEERLAAKERELASARDLFDRTTAELKGLINAQKDEIVRKNDQLISLNTDIRALRAEFDQRLSEYSSRGAGAEQRFAEREQELAALRVQLAGAQKSIAVLTDENARLRRSLSAQEEAAAGTSEQERAYRSRLDELAQARDEAQAASLRIAEELRGVQTSLELAVTEKERILQEYVRVREEADRLAGVADEDAAQIAAQTERIAELETALAAETEAKHALAGTADERERSREKELADANIRILSLQNETAKTRELLDRQITALDTIAADKKEALARAEEHFAAQRDALNVEIERQKETISSLQSDLFTLRAEKNAREEERVRLDRLTAEQQAKIEGLQAQIVREKDAVRSSVDEIERRLRKVQEARAAGEQEARDARAALEARIGAAEKELSSAHAENTRAQNEVQRLSGQLEESRAALRAEQEKTLAYEITVRDLTTKISGIENDVALAQREQRVQLDALESAVKEKDTRIARAAEELARITGQYEQTVADLNNALAARDTELVSLRAALEKAGVARTVQEKDLAAAQAKTARMEQELSDTRMKLHQQIAQYKGRLEQAEERLRKRGDTKDTSAEQLVQAQVALAGMTDELAALRARVQADDAQSQRTEAVAKGRDLRARRVQETLAQTLGKEISAGRILLRTDNGGIRLTVLSDELFSSGRAEVTSEGTIILYTIAQALKQIAAQRVYIEGHTDSQPIRHSEWNSNWELSTARALSVLHYLVEGNNLDPERFTVQGYGEYRPVSDNATERGRSQNRRVEIVIRP